MTPFVVLLHLILSQKQTRSNELGGFLCRLPKNVGYECGVSSPHSTYYFDADIRECIEFMFKGCGGNQNRFPTKEDCIQGCQSLTLCGKGMPLMDFAGNIKRCDGENVPCPGSHECVGFGMESVCCQKADRVCHSSVHGGTPCGVPPQTRYYFDASSNTCRPFSFTGCGGNDNNFKTRGECMQFCSSEIICRRGDPYPDRYSTSRIAACHEDKHCPKNYTCTATLKKKGACCPSTEFVCGTPFDVHSGCRSLLKESVWSFNYKTGECIKNNYPTCEEHLNAFANLEQCIDYCVGFCPNNLEMYYNPQTNQPQLCNTQKNTGCPLGFECFKSSSFAAICCKTRPVCPSAESIALIEGGEHVRCNPYKEESCPEYYSCQRAKNLENICCTRPLSCPDGMLTFRENGGRPRICTPGVEGNCPKDYICAQGDGMAVPGRIRNLCCHPEKKCIIPFIDVITNHPRRCYPGDSSCPSPTTCLPVLEENATSTNTIDMFICCHNADVYTCPDGDMPLIDHITNRPMRCFRSNPMSCPSDLVCTVLMDGSNACCPNPMIDKTCTEIILNIEGSPVNCTGWDDNSCPDGKCRIAADTSYYCCKADFDNSR